METPNKDDDYPSHVYPFGLASLRASLNEDEKERYCRQLVVPGMGLKGQVRLRQASVLIVGAGGLGCPVALYLAGAGIGKIGLVDSDNVDRSNLHRQVAHRDRFRGRPKVESLKESIQELNPTITVETFNTRLSADNALKILSGFDVIVDASDNITTRYVISDACIILGRKPLVSGAALRWDGQISTFCYEETSPCYRCIHPTPPPRDTLMGCAVSGVIGPVTGIIGSLQALEVINIIALKKSNYSGKMLVFSGAQGNSRLIKLRSRQSDCLVCSGSKINIATVNYEHLGEEETACIIDENLRLLSPEERLNPQEFYSLLHEQQDDINQTIAILDVRGAHDYDSLQLPNPIVKVIAVPLSQLEEKLSLLPNGRLICVCRRGNDSQRAVKLLKRHEFLKVQDVKGGLHDYARQYDSTIIPIRSFL